MEQDDVRIRMHAKINTALYATPHMDGGYHRLDTVMVSVSLYDEIVVTKSNHTRVFLDGRRADDSNAHKAVRVLQALGAGDMEVEVKRRIPSGCGLGGSSADAAGVLRAGAELFNLRLSGDDMIRAAFEIGSDVPYMLHGGFARLTGKGDRFERFDAACAFPLLLVSKGMVSTRDCFAAFDRLPPPPPGSADAMIAALKTGDLGAVGARLHNDLTAAAFSLNPSIGRALELFASFGLNACMTGSGSGVFGMGDADALEDAEEAFEEEGYKLYPIVTLSDGVEFL